ncbi:MAG: hypothetical protein HIU83_13355 [Proteobacteria bacterium]|nr:hypothetical protein [Pseudomonadota bacterium]
MINVNEVVKVIGIGTAGGIILENIMKDQMDGIQYIAARTDELALDLSSAGTKILLSFDTKEGLESSPIDCESDPESIIEIMTAIAGADMAVFVAGFGGKTGTIATQVFAKVARSLGIYTVAIVTIPFEHESLYRKTLAKAGEINIRKLVDSVLVMPNDQICNPAGRGILEAFKAGDAIISDALQSCIRKEPSK